jgi:uncharacterized protein (DUF488 family)
MTTIFTIGFTKKPASTFFGLLCRPGLSKLVDARLNNVSQFAGFTKRNDLKFFAETISGIPYFHLPELAPSAEILAAYKKNGGDWEAYERQFLGLLAVREIDKTLSPAWMDGACLLCSEASPTQCHRRLVAEYLQTRWDGVEIQHLI